jgi:hypothetical protein
MLHVMERRKFPAASVKLLASARSAGKTHRFRGEEIATEALGINSFEGVDLALIKPDGSGLTSLGARNAECPVWSPDGMRILYCRNEDASGHVSDNWDIWVMNRDGSGHGPASTARLAKRPHISVAQIEVCRPVRCVGSRRSIAALDQGARRALGSDPAGVGCHARNGGVEVGRHQHVVFVPRVGHQAAAS